jgi:hypothetical protein
MQGKVCEGIDLKLLATNRRARAGIEGECDAYERISRITMLVFPTTRGRNSSKIIPCASIVYRMVVIIQGSLNDGDHID